MAWKRLLALVMCAFMLLAVCACNPDGSESTTGSGDGTTSGTTASILATQLVQKEEIRVPIEEAVNAVKIEASPVTETLEIPLIVILANFDADGDGENDWDENVPDKLYSSKNKNEPYYGEQWAGSELTEHYALYFGEGRSLTNYFEELTMGAFRFVPIAFDVLPTDSPVSNGMIEVTVPISHPSASGDASGTIKKIFEATDPYIDYTKYDTNENGKIDATELGVVILNPSPRFPTLVNMARAAVLCRSVRLRTSLRIISARRTFTIPTETVTLVPPLRAGRARTISRLNPTATIAAAVHTPLILILITECISDGRRRSSSRMASIPFPPL